MTLLRLVLALPVLLASGCTANFYWTDAVVHGEYRATTGERQCAPIPLELRVKP